MTYRITTLATLAVLTALIAAPAYVHGQAPAAQAQEQHDHEHGGAATGNTATSAQRPGMMSPEMMKMMSGMKAESAKLEALVQKMNTAKGTAKTDATAELLTVLVQDHQKMHESMMANMSSMMNMMGTMNGHADINGGSPAK